MREQIAKELRQRHERGETITEVLSWLGKTGTTVGEAVELLEECLDYSHDAAERAIAEHPDWAPLVRLMGGMNGELLQPQPKIEP
jgi:hypothetical protein